MTPVAPVSLEMSLILPLDIAYAMQFDVSTSKEPFRQPGSSGEREEDTLICEISCELNEIATFFLSSWVMVSLGRVAIEIGC